MKNKLALLVFAIGLGVSFSATALSTNACWSNFQYCVNKTHDFDKCDAAYISCCEKATSGPRCML